LRPRREGRAQYAVSQGVIYGSSSKYQLVRNPVETEAQRHRPRCPSNPTVPNFVPSGCLSAFASVGTLEPETRINTSESQSVQPALNL
jgi:hypothetical protein